MEKLTKTEYTTSLIGNDYVYKDHPRIIFRGKLDGLIALVNIIKPMHSGMDRIEEILGVILSGEISGIQLKYFDPTLEELGEYTQEKSHEIGIIKHDVRYNNTYYWLNYLRTQIRECEIAAIQAFKDEEDKREDIITALNRLSSMVHIMMFEETQKTI